MANIRYIVNNTEEAISFYKDMLGFEVEMHPAPGFALLSKDDISLFLNEPGAGGAGQSMPDGSEPQPGGWNRFQIEVEDLPTTVQRLQKQNAHFRGEIIDGKGGKQILIEDPSGNPIELFQKKKNDEKVSTVPHGYYTITPFIATEQPQELIDFIKKAFAGKIHYEMKSEDNVLRHATVKIGDSLVMISSGTDLYQPMPLMLHLFVKDTDSTYEKALSAGAKSLQEPSDEFYGDRRAGVEDVWGNKWWIATHIEDVSKEELKKREEEFRQKNNK